MLWITGQFHEQYSRLLLTDYFSPSRYQAGAPLTEGVEVALDPSELELDPAAMQARLVSTYVRTFLETGD